MKEKDKKGRVFLVGAGPGDPGLITVKGVECLEKADVIIYDYLVSPILLRHANQKAELIYVGKKGGQHTFSQSYINQLIVDRAQNFKIVVRFKGGDPFIFGRGGEEIEALVKAGVDFEIVPGITSGIAASTYAGIPLTHRQYTSDVTLVTGHEDPTKEFSGVDWATLGNGSGTIVFYMGVKNLSNIVDRLVLNGRSKNTPIAVIQWGTTPKQKTLTGVLSTIVGKCEDALVKPPAIIVVGNVVSLRKGMKWFDKRPLIGKSIVVTRSRLQASNLVRKLTELGSECLECPTIKVLPPSDLTLIDRTIDNLGTYNWLIFTSVNGVDFFFKRLFERGKDSRVFGGAGIAAIGPATARRLLRFGLRCDILPKNYYAESITDSFLRENVDRKKICLLRALEARAMLPVELSKMGAFVDDVPVYRTVKTDIGVNELVNRLSAGTVDMVTFTSSSTVRNFKNALPQGLFDDLIIDVAVACIGPITAETAIRLGFEVNVVAKEYTIDGLCTAILNYYSMG